MRQLTYPILVLLALGNSAHALDMSLDDTASAAAVFYSVAQDCSREFKVDVDRAQHFASFARKSAIEKFSQQAIADAFASALKKQQQEIQITGLTQWCRSRRQMFGRMALGIFKE
jgi:hypothetical protein